MLAVSFCLIIRQTYMRYEPTSQLSTIERLERALVLLAYFIKLDGDVHIPMYEKVQGRRDPRPTFYRPRQRRVAAPPPDREGDSWATWGRAYIVLPLADVEGADYAHRAALCADPMGFDPRYEFMRPPARERDSIDG